MMSLCLDAIKISEDTDCYERNSGIYINHFNSFYYFIFSKENVSNSKIYGNNSQITSLYHF